MDSNALDKPYCKICNNHGTHNEYVSEDEWYTFSGCAHCGRTHEHSWRSPWGVGIYVCDRCSERAKYDLSRKEFVVQPFKGLHNNEVSQEEMDDVIEQELEKEKSIGKVSFELIQGGKK